MNPYKSARWVRGEFRRFLLSLLCQIREIISNTRGKGVGWKSQPFSAMWKDSARSTFGATYLGLPNLRNCPQNPRLNWAIQHKRKDLYRLGPYSDTSPIPKATSQSEIAHWRFYYAEAGSGFKYNRMRPAFNQKTNTPYCSSTTLGNCTPCIYGQNDTSRKFTGAKFAQIIKIHTITCAIYRERLMMQVKYKIHTATEFQKDLFLGIHMSSARQSRIFSGLSHDQSSLQTYLGL